MITKKQHYVPRFLLRNFAADEEKKTINAFLFKNNKIAYSIGLKNQAYRSYLYGADQVLENSLSLVESSAASIIRKLAMGYLKLTNDEEKILKLFITLQKHRTPYSSAVLNGQIDSFLKEAFKHETSVKDHINEFKVRLTDPYLFQFSLAIELSPILADLKIGLLNSKKKSFLIGEHPVVILNPYLYQKKWILSKSGLGVIGTIILMPISSQYTVILYDKDIYRLSNRQDIVEITESDLNNLNYCQILQSSDCVYFNTIEYSQENFIGYLHRSKEFREKSKTITGTSEYQGKKNSEIIHSSHIDLPVDQNFSFIGILEKAMLRELPNNLDILRKNAKIVNQAHFNHQN